ncbi:MAG: PD-(D/E)XK motif protein [Kouleothrix sp.]|nr:PD-(D/E)XK motif protein [Kouleothrix sp.]
MLNLVALFEALEPPTVSEDSDGRFAACPIPGFEQSRIAKDETGAPALLIQAKEERASPFVSISLEHLSVLHNIECAISHPSGSQEVGRFSVVRCIAGDRYLYQYFLQMLEGVVLSLGSSPSQKEITRAINTLVELFRVIEEPARKSVQGFWAELLVIAQASEPMALVTAWHSNVLDVYDFNAGNQRIEIKSASGRVRQHHFGLAQLQPPPGTKVLIASIFMEQAGAGVSLAELIAIVR